MPHPPLRRSFVVRILVAVIARCPLDGHVEDQLRVGRARQHERRSGSSRRAAPLRSCIGWSSSAGRRGCGSLPGVASASPDCRVAANFLATTAPFAVRQQRIARRCQFSAASAAGPVIEVFSTTSKLRPVSSVGKYSSCFSRKLSSPRRRDADEVERIHERVAVLHSKSLTPASPAATARELENPDWDIGTPGKSGMVV